MIRLSSYLLVVAALAVAPAGAHITLQSREASIGTAYKAVFVVPHGCAGSPTIKLHVQIPDGVIALEAQPTAGWNVETTKGKYADAYDPGRQRVRGHQGGRLERRQATRQDSRDLRDRHLAHRHSEAEHNVVFSCGSGVRAGREPLGRNPDR
jgi:uncharacterized protein YcnI